MHHSLKGWLVGIGMTALSLVVIFWAVRQFAPASVKSLFSPA